MDIRSIDIVGTARDGYELDVIHPVTNESTGIKITVIGAMTPSYRDDMHLLMADIDDFRDSLRIDEAKSKKEKAELQNKLTAYDDKKTAELLAKYTKGWTGMVEDGKPLEFSQETAARVYLEYPIIRGQVQKAMTTLSNFIKA